MAAIELGGIQLNRVHKITTLEQANLIEHPIPGLAGNIIQNLGRDSVRLQVEGIFYGTTAKDDLEALRTLYKRREPVDFLAEITGQAYFGQVMLEQFEVFQLAEDPNQFSYRLIVSEYVVLPEKAPPGPSAVEAAIQAEAQSTIDVANAIETMKLPEFKDPSPLLQGTLKDVKTALEGLSGVKDKITNLFGE